MENEMDLECETLSYTCVCVNCGKAFTGEEPYWRWIGLDEQPPDEKDDA